MSRSLLDPTSTWLSITIGADGVEVLLLEAGELLVPPFLARLRIERDQVVVRA